MTEQRRTAQSTTRPENASEPHDPQALEAKGRKIGEELDAVLGAIDDVLEDNAAEFVKDYVQHGGQ